ncbi:MAG: sigma-70 family RNA polymerase sigma factor [Bacteroidota bacterium]
MDQERKFVQIIRENEGLIYKVSSIYAQAREDRLDLYQEIVLQLWKAWKKYRGEAKVSTWMYRVAMNTGITYIRKQKRRARQVELDNQLLNRAENLDPALEERMNLLYRHIESLGKLDKGLILLYLEDRNYEEIAEITGLSKSNVGTRLSRIKQKLKNQMLKQT